MDLPEFVAGLAGAKQKGVGYEATCPAHDDRDPSLSISEGDDGRILLFCHGGCSIDAILKALGLQKRDLFVCKNGDASAKKRSGHDGSKHDQPQTIGERAIERAHEALDEKWRRMLREERMLSDKVIDRYRLGVFNRYGNQRLGIPVFDETGAAVDVRLWLHPGLRTDGQAKILSWAKGFGRARLYPLDQLSEETVVLCAGELDALAAISNGIAAITATCGETTWPDRLSMPLAGKRVQILLDNDDAGRKGTEMRAQSLARHRARVEIVTW